MAYLDNTVITVDAVLTKLGRERLSQGLFDIKKWAVSDDEIDYSLYNTAHPLGTDYYSNIIESMPVLEAIPDETQALRYKLYTASDRRVLPVLNWTTTADGTTLTWNPTDPVEFPVTVKTDNYDPDEEYVIVLFDESVAEIRGNIKITPSGAPRANIGGTISAFSPGGARNISTTRVETLNGEGTFTVRAKDPGNSAKTTKIRITGVDTGVTATFSFTVNPD